MSCLNLSTNVSLEGVDTSSILSEASSTVAEIIGKPEAYVMIVLNGSVLTPFGGMEGPFVYGELDSIGGLNSDVNKKLCDAIANILEAKLFVPKSRFHLKFYDSKGSNIGWNGSTFLVSEQQDQQRVPTGWRVTEDIALMSSWCFVSEDQVPGKNRNGEAFWARVHNKFQEAQAKNPEAICKRNIDSIKGRWRRLSENVNKWIVAYKEAYGRKRSGMSHEDIENEAHSIYEEGGSKFQDLVVFNEVMSKHPKWDLTLNCDLTRSRAENEGGNEENGGGSKRSKTSKDGEISIPANPETSSIPRPTDGDKDCRLQLACMKPESLVISGQPYGGEFIPRPCTHRPSHYGRKKEKLKAPQQSYHTNDIAAAEIRALILTSDNEAEIMSMRIDLEREKLQRNALKMKEIMLNILLAKDHLSPEEEDMKRRLIAIVFGD